MLQTFHKAEGERDMASSNRARGETAPAREVAIDQAAKGVRAEPDGEN